MANKQINIIPNANKNILSGTIDFDNQSCSINTETLRKTLTKLIPKFYKNYAVVNGIIVNANGTSNSHQMNLQYSLSAGNGIMLSYGNNNLRNQIGINTDDQTVKTSNGKLVAVKYTADDGSPLEIEDADNGFDKKIKLNSEALIGIASLTDNAVVDLADAEFNELKKQTAAKIINDNSNTVTSVSADIEAAKTFLETQINTLSTDINGLQSQINDKTTQLRLAASVLRTALLTSKTNDINSSQTQYDNIKTQINELVAKRNTQQQQLNVLKTELNILASQSENVKYTAVLQNILNRKAAFEAAQRSWFEKAIEFVGTPFAALGNAAADAASYVTGIFTNNGDATDNTLTAATTVNSALAASLSSISFKVPIKVADTEKLYFGNDKAKDALVLSSDLSVVGSGNNAKVKAIKGIPLTGSGSTDGLTIDIDVVTNVEWNDNLGKIHTSGYELSFQDGILTATNELTSISTIDTIPLSEAQAN